MPSSPRVKPPEPIWSDMVNAAPDGRRRRRRPPGRPGPGLGVDRWAAAAERGRRAGRGWPGRRARRPATRSPPTAPGQDEVAALLAELSPPPGRCSSTSTTAAARPTAGSARHTVLPEDAATPAEELLARRLLVAAPGGQVVGARRGQHRPARRAHHPGAGRRGARRWRPPSAPPALVDRAAAGAAFEVVRRVELLLDHWGTHPPAALRSRRARGARPQGRRRPTCTSTRPPRRCSSRSPRRPGCSRAAADADGNPVLAPTDAFDAWRAGRGRALGAAGRAWLDQPRLPGLVGTRDAAGKARNALAPETASGLAAETRADGARRARRRSRPARCWRPAPGRPSLVARLRLAAAAPAARSRADQVAWALAEAAILGVTGARRPAVVRPGAARRRRPRAARSRRCCPSRSTTCCSRPT